jgi:hypothetical protein
MEGKSRESWNKGVDDDTGIRDAKDSRPNKIFFEADLSRYYSINNTLLWMHR